jgi:predicted nucleic acid-binding protein
MRVFLDANVLVSVLNKEYPLFPYSARLLSLSDQSRFQLFTSPICLAIAFYFAEQKAGSAMAKQKIAILHSKLNISVVDQEVVHQALKHPQVVDFENGLEYFSAVQASCEAIVSEDANGFYFSSIPVYDCRKFLEEVVY